MVLPMNFDAQMILSLILVALYFAFVFFWVKFVQSRLRVWIRESLANYWKVTINERVQYRNISWVISGPHTRGQSILANIVLFVTDFGCLVGPIFAALAAIVLVMMLVSE
jgi:hypothetical protein